MIIDRELASQIQDKLEPNKVLFLLGPRRVGKTMLIQQLMQKLPHQHMHLNGEDITTIEMLARRSVQNYKTLLGNTQYLFIDEAQKIPEIGQVLKLMVDEIPNLKILVTGSSAFDIEQTMGEPLTGRKKTFYMYPISESEYDPIESAAQRKDRMHERLVYGNYPELLHIKSQDDKADYLKELVNDYLLKDVLAYENIKNSDKIIRLLRLIAFQVGSEVSLSELGSQIGMSKNTVEKYLDLLSKVFIVFKLGGFSRNLRKEITKSSKWYFYDNGIRNILVANMNPIELRNDLGELWENYIISERIKYQAHNRMIVNNYFWRTYDQQEIDWVEEREGQLHGYEMKWNPKRKVRPPAAWKKAYTDASYEIINGENYREWVL